MHCTKQLKLYIISCIIDLICDVLWFLNLWLVYMKSSCWVEHFELFLSYRAWAGTTQLNPFSIMPISAMILYVIHLANYGPRSVK